MTEKTPDNELTKEPRRAEYVGRAGGEEIDLRAYWAILWPRKWKIAGLSLAVGVAVLLLMFQIPNKYQATAVIAPEDDQKKPSFALGALASFGVDIGGAAGLVDLEMLFTSKDLTARVFRKYNLWPVVFPEEIDPATGKKKVSWMGGLFGDEKEPKPPGDWDAIRAAKGLLKVNSNRKNGMLTISFESRSADWSANIVKYYLEEGKSRLQEEALDRAVKNKKFIEGQIGKTVDALTRDRLYFLFGQEVEREMMARNREQFGFRVVDAPRIPDRKSRPRRGLAAIMATLFAGFAFSIYFIVRDRRKELTVEFGDQ